MLLAIALVLVFAAPALAANANGCYDGTGNGAIIRWTFNNADVSGLEQRDSCGENTNGTLSAGVTTGVAGKFGEAFSMNGAGTQPDAGADYVYNLTTTEPILTAADALSWNYWLKPASAPAANAFPLFPDYNTGANGWQGGYDSAGSLKFGCAVADTAGRVIPAQGAVASGIGAWTMISCTWLPANKTLFLYTNGTFTSSATNAAEAGAFYSAGGYYSVGAAKVSGWDYGFNGAMDEIQYYNYTLNQTEITYLNTHATLPTTLPPTLTISPNAAPINEAQVYTASVSSNVTDATGWWWSFAYAGVPYFTSSGAITSTQTLNVTGNWSVTVIGTFVGVNSTATENVTVVTRPVANFTYTPPAFVGVAHTFTDHSTVDANSTLAKWFWDEDGDGLIESIVQNASITFAAAGYTNVSLYVEDNLQPQK